MNQFMDLIKSLLVILIPWPETFGYLVIASFCSVSIGNILFDCYSCRLRPQ